MPEEYSSIIRRTFDLADTLEVEHRWNTSIGIPYRELIVYTCCQVVTILNLCHLKSARYQA